MATIELTDRHQDDRGPIAVCDGSLPIDRMRIHEVAGPAMRPRNSPA